MAVHRDLSETYIMFTFITFSGALMKLAFKVSLDLPCLTKADFEREAAVIQQDLPKMCRAFVQLRRARQEVKSDQLVQLFVGDIAPTPVDMESARLHAKAWRQILTGGEWLTAAEVGELANLGTGNPVATVNRWKKERKIFAVTRDGRDYFARYALGPDFRPLPAVAAVLKVLPWQGGDRLAAWFESTSSFFGGKRPREVLASDPAWVERGALDAVEAESFAG
jgi:hypothetical protein